MKIWIHDIGASASAQVRFDSAIGRATAVWRGGARPRAGQQDVEFEIDVAVIRGQVWDASRDQLVALEVDLATGRVLRGATPRP
jgi:hypothetical protein